MKNPTTPGAPGAPAAAKPAIPAPSTSTSGWKNAGKMMGTTIKMVKKWMKTDGTRIENHWTSWTRAVILVIELKCGNLMIHMVNILFHILIKAFIDRYPTWWWSDAAKILWFQQRRHLTFWLDPQVKHGKTHVSHLMKKKGNRNIILTLSHVYII